jgi:hypothetical protein
MGQKKDLDKLPQPQRDSILVAAAKATIIRYAPEYDHYTHSTPEIIRRVATREDEEYNRSIGYRVGRVWYTVKYPTPKEFVLTHPYAIKYIIEVDIWENNAYVSSLTAGGYGTIWKKGINPHAEDNTDYSILVAPDSHDGKWMMYKSEYEQWKRDNNF